MLKLRRIFFSNTRHLEARIKTLENRIYLTAHILEGYFVTAKEETTEAEKEAVVLTQIAHAKIELIGAEYEHRLCER